MVAQGVGTLVEFAASGLSCVHVREVLRRCRRPSLVFERFAEHCACVIRVATERGQEIDLCEQLCQALIRNGTPFSRWDREPGVLDPCNYNPVAALTAGLGGTFGAPAGRLVGSFVNPIRANQIGIRVGASGLNRSPQHLTSSLIEGSFVGAGEYAGSEIYTPNCGCSK